MKVYQLTRKQTIGSTFLCAMSVNRDVIFFTNKEEAKKIQNPFKGDKVKEVILSKPSSFIFNIRMCFNIVSYGQSFSSGKEAKKYCVENKDSKYDMEVFKHKVYSSAQEYRESSYKVKSVHQN